MLQVNVRGGTNAGRITRKNRLKQAWKCAACNKSNAYYWKNCPSCLTARPKE